MEVSEGGCHIDEFFRLISSLNALWVYLVLFGSAVIETLFPPYPGDTIVLLAGYLAGSGHIHPAVALLSAVAGSMAGGLILFSLGMSRGRSIFQRGRFRFLSPNRLGQVEGWFECHGKKVILASRFLPGIRSLVALAAGIGRVRTPIFVLFSLISISIWNGLLLLLGLQLGQNWTAVVRWIRIYNWVIVILVLLVLSVWYLRRYGPLRSKRDGGTRKEESF